MTGDILAEAKRRNITNILGKVASGTPLSSTETKTLDALDKMVKERDSPTMPPIIRITQKPEAELEPPPAAKRHPAPQHLRAGGREIWYQFCNATSDFRTLEIWASSYDRWMGAKEDINANGMSLITINERGQSVAKANPACAVEAQAARIMMACQKTLGKEAENPVTDAFSEYD